MEKLNHPSDLKVQCLRYGLPSFPLILWICKSKVQCLIASYMYVFANFRIPTEAHISWLRCSLPAWWVARQFCVAPPQPGTQWPTLHFVACSTNTKCWKPEMQCCCQASYGNMHSLHSLVEEQTMNFHVCMVKSVSP